MTRAGPRRTRLGPRTTRLVVPVLSPRAPSLEPSDCVYEIVPRGPLPEVDLARSVRRELLSPRAQRWWQAIVRRVWFLLVPGYNIGIALAPLALVLPGRAGQLVALLSPLLGLLGGLSLLFSLRVDLVRLLVRTYDFWFFSVVNALACVALALLVRDLRVLLVGFMGFGYEMCILIDANMTFVRLFVVPATLAFSLNVSIYCLAQLRLIANPRDLGLSIHGHSVALSDVVCSGMITLGIMLCRNAYRRRAAVKTKSGDRLSTHCISFRCAVTLRRLDAAELLRGRRRETAGLTLSRANLFRRGESMKSHLHMVPIDQLFDGGTTVLGRLLPEAMQTPWSWRARGLLLLLAATAAALSSVAYVIAVVIDTSEPRWLFVSAFAGTSTLTALFWALSQPTLLRRIVVSFDFAFVSLQLTVAHVCVCDTLRWDARAWIIMAGWLWIHWVLTLDAVLPVTRQRMGFQRWFAVPVVALFAGAQIVFGAKLVLARGWDIFDREVFRGAIGGADVRIHTVPFLFNRIVILACWSLRLLWRVVVSRGDELIVVQGTVAYDYVARPRAMDSDATSTWRGFFSRVKDWSKPVSMRHDRSAASRRTQRSTRQIVPMPRGIRDHQST
ncbi:hypothetical protein ATCC90586_005838 [Pythium insidiosum]|nr:hypothetical protein ATCC90586_005838 [Pythium insidiosum]